MPPSRADQATRQDFPDQNPDSASWSYAAAAGGIANSTAGVPIMAAATPLRSYLSSLDVATDMLGAATELVIRDGAAGPVLWRVKLQTTPLPLVSVVFAQPLKSSPGALLEVATLTASVTGAVYVNARGYVGL